MKKKLLSIIMSLVMFFTIIPNSIVFANEESKDHPNAVDLINQDGLEGSISLSPNNNLFYLLSRSFMFNKRHFLFDHKVLRILLICFLPAGRHFLEPESEQLRIDLPSEMDSS